MSHRILLALGWSLSVVVAVWIPGRWLPVSESVDGHLDKVLHAGFFVGFGLLWMRAGRRRMRAAWVLAAGLLLAVLTELVQAAPAIGRDADPLDALADVGGALLGIGMYHAARGARGWTRAGQEDWDSRVDVASALAFVLSLIGTAAGFYVALRRLARE